MRGSLQVHTWSLVLFCGWSVWASVRERIGARTRSSDPPRVVEPTPTAPPRVPRMSRPARVDPRSLPN
jgi:hypothetical protein